MKITDVQMKQLNLQHTAEIRNGTIRYCLAYSRKSIPNGKCYFAASPKFK